MLRASAIAIDADDPSVLAPFWAAVTGWVAEPADEGGDVTVRDPARPAPYLDLLIVPESKTVKNRLHLDFRPDDRDAEVERIVALGATHTDVGQGEQTWVVLSDPEDNEFCILSSRV